MLQMLAQILHNLRTQQILIFLLERIPFHVDIIVGQLQRILDIVLIGSVKDRSGYVKAKGLGRQDRDFFRCHSPSSLFLFFYLSCQ